MELESAPTTPFEPKADPRRRLDEPLPVRLVTVADAQLEAPAGLEPQLDEFYADLLEFERSPLQEAGPVYLAENFALRFQVIEAAGPHESMRPLGVEVLSLADLEQKLIEREIEYARIRGLVPGQECLSLQDPAGNWLEIVEARTIG